MEVALVRFTFVLEEIAVTRCGILALNVNLCSTGKTFTRTHAAVTELGVRKILLDQLVVIEYQSAVFQLWIQEPGARALKRIRGSSRPYWVFCQGRCTGFFNRIICKLKSGYGRKECYLGVAGFFQCCWCYP